MSAEQRAEKAAPSLVDAYRFRASLFKWLLRSFALGVAGCIALLGIVLPTVSTLAGMLAALLFILFVVCWAIALTRFFQFMLSRRSYYKRLPAAERATAYNAELRRRGAPGWYIRMHRAGRTAYGGAVLVVAIALAILRPFPGDSHFGLRMSLFIPAFLGTLGVLWYLRTRS